MGHKASAEFFRTKKHWSKRKDCILTHYVTPYLAKVGRLGKPILLVDAFAGPGQFGDGEPGSPLILSRIVAESKASVPIELLAVEIESDLHSPLAVALAKFAFARTRLGSFLDALPEMESAARTHTVFLYLDPYTVEGLEWDPLVRVFEQLRLGRSVEILLNFNAPSFVRRGLSVLKQPLPPESEEDMEDCALAASSPSAEKLDAVVGGSWWRETLTGMGDYAEKVQAVTDRFCRQLGEHFREVCMHAVKAEGHHTVPKFYLLFGSRSEDALKLMNDAMCRSREMLAGQMNDNGLFELRPEDVVPDASRLPAFVLDCLTEKMSRGTVLAKIIRSHFGKFSETEIRQCVTKMIKDGRVRSETGRSRIPNGEEIWATGR